MKKQHLSIRFSRMVLLGLFVLLVLAVPGESFARNFYVSVDGHAQADGSLAKPYGSLPEAVQAVRALRRAGDTKPAVIYLREGRHQLNQTVVLGIEDGSPAAAGDVTLQQYGAGDDTGPAFSTFAAHPGEHPVISAGVPVTGWKRLAPKSAELPTEAVGKVWVADIPAGLEKFSDGDAIYVSGAGTGNIIRYNYVHDNQAHSLPAAIRCDDDQHETLIYGNVLYKNRGHAAAIASKGVNDIVNNFIVAQTAVPRWGYISFEWAPVTGSKVQRNIVVCHPAGGNAYAERLRSGQTNGGPKLASTDMDRNLYFHPADSHWMDEHLLKMRSVGKEKGSHFGDPLFVDPAGGDFSFRPESPALALGFESLDVSKMGRVDPESTKLNIGGHADRIQRYGHGFSEPNDFTPVK